MSGVTELLRTYFPSFLPTCARCHKPAPEPEHLYQLGDDRWYCLSCIVERYSEAELKVHQERLAERDDAYTMVAHLRHVTFHTQPMAGCEFCVVAA